MLQQPISLRARYAMPGTSAAYQHTYPPTHLPVLTSRLVLQQVQSFRTISCYTLCLSGTTDVGSWLVPRSARMIGNCGGVLYAVPTSYAGTASPKVPNTSTCTSTNAKGSCLRACYAMPGTVVLPLWYEDRVCCYHAAGTDVVYAATRLVH